MVPLMFKPHEMELFEKMSKVGLRQCEGPLGAVKSNPVCEQLRHNLLKDTPPCHEGICLRTAPAFQAGIQRTLWGSPFKE